MLRFSPSISSVLFFLLAVTLHGQVAWLGAGDLRFIENRGQIVDAHGELRPEILYEAESNGVHLYFRRDGISYVFTRVGEGMRDSTSKQDAASKQDTRSLRLPVGEVTVWRLDVSFVGAGEHGTVIAEERADEYRNYYYPHCRRGLTHVPCFSRLVYHDIYPNVDLIFHATADGMKYDVLVRPGGDLDRVRLRYVGADSLMRIDGGRNRISTPLGEVIEGMPNATSNGAGGGGSRVESIGTVIEGSDLRFVVGAYPRSRTLLVDPILQWSTYFGGNSGVNSDVEMRSTINGLAAHALTCDGSGNVTLAATALGVAFPTTTGAFQTASGGGHDACLVKFTYSGNRAWASYYGGSGDEFCNAAVAAPNNDIAIVGSTASTDLPLASGAFQGSNGGGVSDAFVVRFDSTGVRLWDTYFGGAGVEYAEGIAVDPWGYVIIGGTTESTSMATSGAYQTSPAVPPSPNFNSTDAFVARFTPGGARVWSTYLGGTSMEGHDVTVCVDIHGNIYVSGSTTSIDFPVSSNAYLTTPSGNSDLYLTKFDSSGAFQWSTYFGGSAAETSAGVAVDGDSLVYIIGNTYSRTLPLTNGTFQTSNGSSSTNADGVLVKFSASGSPRWATFIGGSVYDWIGPLMIDGNHNAVVTGTTTSSNFPVTSNGYLTSPATAGNEAVVVEVTPSGGLGWGTYLSGSGGALGYGIARYHSSIFVAGLAGSNFPTTSNAYQSSQGPIFIAKLCIPDFQYSISGTRRFCEGDTAVLTAPAELQSLTWSTGATGHSIRVRQAGRYWFTGDDNGCSFRSDTVTVVVDPLPTPSIVPRGPTTFCDGDSVRLDAGAGFSSYRWSTGDTTRTILVKVSGIFTVTVANTHGCSAASAAMRVTVDPLPVPSITTTGATTFCDGDSVTLTAGPAGCTYLWSTGATTQSIVVKKSGSYGVTVTNSVGCSAMATPVSITVNSRPDATVRALTATTFCAGDSAILQAASAGVQYRWSNGEATRRIVVRAGGVYTLMVTDSNGCSARSAPIVVQMFERPHPKIIADGPTRFCAGGSVTLDAGDDYASYVWSTGFGSRKITVTESGRYSVTVTNDVGCSATSDEIYVQVDPRPVISINGPSSVCASTRATYSVSPIDGVSFDWDVTGGGGTILGDPKSNAISVQWGASGAGTVHVRATLDSSGCVADTAMTVVAGAGLVPTITASRSLKLCVGDSVTLDAGSYSSYRWSTGATSRTIVVAQPGAYLVIVSDASGCSGTSKPVVVTVDPDPIPAITASRGTSICRGDSTILDAGPGWARYRWSNGFTTRILTAKRAGVYSVMVTDSSGCTGSSAPLTITEIPPPAIEILGPSVVCRGSTVSYVAAPADGSSYSWRVSGGLLVSADGKSTVLIQWGNGPAGTVTLSERTANGCLGETTLGVEVGEKLEPIIVAQGATALCAGSKLVLDAGDGYASYRWSTGETTRTITVDAAGSYSVTVADANGCSGTSQPIAVTVHEAPAAGIDPAGPVTLCDGDSILLTATEPGLVYRWTGGQITRSIMVTKSGGYSVTVTNGDGCAATSSVVTVTVTPVPPKPSIVADGDVLSTQDAEQYQWSRNEVPIVGATAQRYRIDGPGSYTVTIGSGGCTATSDPWVRASQPVAWLDTVGAAVGDRVWLYLHLAPMLRAGDGATGYHVVLKLPTRGLFPHRAVDALSGAQLSMKYGVDGMVTIDRHGASGPITGDRLLSLEMEGLSSADPLNPVDILSVDLDGIGQLPVVGEGLVILSGCDVGRNVGFGKRVQIVSVSPNPIATSMTVIYRAPKGSTPTLSVVDVDGREMSMSPLPSGTGEPQTATTEIDGVPSGVYRLDLRDGTERVSVPVLVVR